MMDKFYTRINKISFYKSIGETKIDYHAGIYFIYKTTRYLKFTNFEVVKFHERIEGQHVYDTDYLQLNKFLENSNDISKAHLKPVSWNENMVTFSIKRNDKFLSYNCLPSKLLELVEGEITEIALDSIDNSNRGTEIYSLVTF